jgi:hypothetical protein
LQTAVNIAVGSAGPVERPGCHSTARTGAIGRAWPCVPEWKGRPSAAFLVCGLEQFLQKRSGFASGTAENRRLKTDCHSKKRAIALSISHPFKFMRCALDPCLCMPLSKTVTHCRATCFRRSAA